MQPASRTGRNSSWANRYLIRNLQKEEWASISSLLYSPGITRTSPLPIHQSLITPLQELLYSIPLFRKIKKHKLPFWFTNGIRAAVFVLMLLFLFAIIGGKKGTVIYHYVNGFNLFNIDFDYLSIIIAIVATGALGLFTYRPYCSLLCPFGFVSWLFEKASVVGIRINYDACTRCGACSRACPNQSAQDRVHGKAMPADCFSCMRCLDTCPTDAIRYGVHNPRKGRSQTGP